jgi:hypothetical protein
MYNGQYAKGLAHLVIFMVLVSLSHMSEIFGLLVSGWIFYMAIEAYQTAKARRDGLPLPNPFGFNELGERLGFGANWPGAGPFAGGFGTHAGPSAGTAADPVAGSATSGFGTGTRANSASGQPGGTDAPNAGPYTPPWTPPYTPPGATGASWGAPQDAWGAPGNPWYGSPYGAVPPVDPAQRMPPPQRFPVGAIWLIGLGVVFLLGNMGFFFLRARYVGPVLLIGLGVFVFVRRMTCNGGAMENDGTPAYQWRLTRAIRSSVWLVATGVIWLLDALDVLRWGQSWPLFLIVAGVLLFVRRSVLGGPMPPMPGYGYPPYPGTPQPPPSPASTTTAIVPVDDLRKER